MTGFDREELKAALEAGRIRACDDYIRRLDGLLRAIAQKYRARKSAREQDLNAQLMRLEESKDFIDSLWEVATVFYAFDLETPTIIHRLSDTVDQAIAFIKIEKGQRKIRRDHPETALFMDLRDLYVALSGTSGISDDGPLHRFATACAKLIDQNIVLTQPQSLRKALKRRATAPSYSRQHRKGRDSVHSGRHGPVRDRP